MYIYIYIYICLYPGDGVEGGGQGGPKRLYFIMEAHVFDPNACISLQTKKEN